jgi:hypothetical protein
MTSSTLSFGTIGRCACGAIGRRRSAFADEPICAKCLPLRSSFLKLDPDGLVVGGRLTPSQRRARVEWLIGSAVREAELCAVRDEIHACAVGSANVA